MRPEMSGTPSPESNLPSGKDSGGKVTGIRMTVAGRPPASLQNVFPRRLLRTPGRVGGTQALTPVNTAAPAATPRNPRTIGAATRRRMRRKPAAPAGKKTRAAAAAKTAGFARPKSSFSDVSSATANVGTRSEGFRFRKSKISWPPGSRPVENVAHDTGVCAGTVGRSGEYPPRAFNAARFGSRPDASICSMTWESTPSNPSTTTRAGFAGSAGRGAERAKNSAAAATVRILMGAPSSLQAAGPVVLRAPGLESRRDRAHGGIVVAPPADRGPGDPVPLHAGVHPLLRGVRSLHDGHGPAAGAGAGARPAAGARGGGGRACRGDGGRAPGRDSARLVLAQARGGRVPGFRGRRRCGPV